MNKKHLGALAGVFLFILGCAVAQSRPPSSSPQSPTSQAAMPSTQRPSPSPTPGSGKQMTAVVELAKGGSFAIALRPETAPNTVANFVTKSREKKYDNLTFHRVEDWVVQGGDPLGTGTGGGKMPSELNQLSFSVGAVGIARGQDIKINNDYQWFVVKKDASWLNGQYTNFGMVVSGMEIVTGIKIGDRIKTIRIEER